MASQKPSDRRKSGLDGDFKEPDLTPIMNLTFMLILSMLTMASFLPIGLITVQAPRLGGGADASPPPDKPEDDKPPLSLTVFVKLDGFDLAASGASLDGSSEGREGERLIPRVAQGGVEAYNFANLQKRLVEIKKAFPKEQSVTIVGDEDVLYEDIVSTMDAARETEDGTILFPAVAFSAGLVG